MNLKLLSIILAGVIVYNQPQAIVTAMLHGNSEAEARSYIYQIHPSYCSCKELCMSGCAPSMCNNCVKAVQGICDVLIEDGSVLRQCKENVSGDLQGTLKVPSKTQKISMPFNQTYGFDYFHIYRVGSYLSNAYPHYLACKKICNNLDQSSTQAQCDACRTAVCNPSSACGWGGPNSSSPLPPSSSVVTQCVLACNADLLFYDYKFTPNCQIRPINCKPVFVEVSEQEE